MKKLIGFFLFLFLVSCGSKKNDLENMNLQGDVKSVTELQFTTVVIDGKKVEKGAPFRDGDWNSKIDFDKKGRFQEIVLYGLSNEVIGKTTYEYDDKGLLKGCHQFDENGDLDINSQISYDEKDRKIQTLNLNADGYLVEKQMIEYNDDNLIETTCYYGKKNDLTKKIVCQMDKKGFPKETKIYNGERKLINYRMEKYGDNGNLSQLYVLSPESEEVTMVASFTYDKNGNLLKQEAMDSRNGEEYEAVSYKYEYDYRENWIKRIQYIGSDPFYIVERNIEYY